jgi:hypothetical protein
MHVDGKFKLKAEVNIILYSLQMTARHFMLFLLASIVWNKNL